MSQRRWTKGKSGGKRTQRGGLGGWGGAGDMSIMKNLGGHGLLECQCAFMFNCVTLTAGDIK